MLLSIYTRRDLPADSGVEADALLVVSGAPPCGFRGAEGELMDKGLVSGVYVLVKVVKVVLVSWTSPLGHLAPHSKPQHSKPQPSKPRHRAPHSKPQPSKPIRTFGRAHPANTNKNPNRAQPSKPIQPFVDQVVVLVDMRLVDLWAAQHSCLTLDFVVTLEMVEMVEHSALATHQPLLRPSKEAFPSASSVMLKLSAFWPKGAHHRLEQHQTQPAETMQPWRNPTWRHQTFERNQTF